VKLVALDLSLTATGYAVWTGALEYGTLRPPNLTGFPRLDWIRSKAATLAEGADLVIMEGISFMSNDPGSQERIGLAFLIRFLLWHRETPFVLCPPQTLKKFVVGHAGKKDPATGEKIKVTKDLMIKELYKRFGHDVNDNNEADAIGLLYVGRALLGDWQPTMDAQRQVIAGLQKANGAALARVGVSA
jgi:hypothetical protein